MVPISRSNNLNLLRLLAALQVVYGHFTFHLGLWPGGQNLFHLTVLAFPGVAIFFVLSGFLVSDSHLRLTSIRTYAKRRIRRIYPGLWANLLVLELAVLATGGLNLDQMNSGFYVVHALTGQRQWASLLFGDPFISAFFQAYPSGVLWTIGVELTFYAVLPIALLVVKRNRLMGSLIVAAAALGSVAFTYSCNITTTCAAGATVAPYFWIFAFGILGRIYWGEVRQIFEDRAAWWLLCYLAIVFALYFRGDDPQINFVAPSGLDIVRMAILAGSVLSAGFTLPRPGLLRGYDLSYGVYLYHMLVVYVFLGFGVVGHRWLWLVGCAGTFVLAWLSWTIVESPAERLQFSRPRPATPRA